jgi:hypothetical protein
MFHAMSDYHILPLLGKYWPSHGTLCWQAITNPTCYTIDGPVLDCHRQICHILPLLGQYWPSHGTGCWQAITNPTRYTSDGPVQVWHWQLWATFATLAIIWPSTGLLTGLDLLVLGPFCPLRHFGPFGSLCPFGP